MSPLTHALVGWMIANSVPLSRRERALVMGAGVVPDLDGLGLLIDLATWSSASPTHWYEHYHHLLGHNLGFALAITALACCLVPQRMRVAMLVLLSVHLHFLGDLLGARGPDGYPTAADNSDGLKTR